MPAASVSPDRAHNSSDNASYQSVPVNAATEADMLLNQSKDYTLQIDANGDGVVDTQKQPDSVISNYIDLTPPAGTTDLAVTSVSSGTAALAFTAPGGDGNAGTAQYYDIRYSTTPISEDNWKGAMPIEQDPAPLPAGSQVMATATGLNAGTTYFFAMKSEDEALLSSGLSNVAITTTTIPSLSWAVQRIYWASWADYQARRLTVAYKLANQGTGVAIGATIAASTCTPSSVYVTTALPLPVGDLEPGISSTVSLKYYVPANVGSFTTTTYVNSRDDAGGTYWYPRPMP